MAEVSRAEITRRLVAAIKEDPDQITRYGGGIRS
jgi:hypothetical protein